MFAIDNFRVTLLRFLGCSSETWLCKTVNALCVVPASPYNGKGDHTLIEVLKVKR